MNGSIKINNGKKHYFIKDGEIRYIYIHNRHRHIDVEKLFKAIDNKEEVYGIQEIKTLKIDENLEKEYFEQLLKITSQWKNTYHNNSILDGKQWSIKIDYNDNKLSFFGSNEYPDNWSEFENFLEDIINNGNNNFEEKIALSTPIVETINPYLNKKHLQYSLLELTIYNVISIYPKEQQTLFNCACLLNEELNEIYADKKDLLFIQSEEFIINHLSEIFFELKNKNKDLYNQIIEDVIESVTYYCMKHSDQLLQISLEFVGLDGISDVVNLAHIVIDYKENVNLNKYAQMIMKHINDINYYQAIDIIKDFTESCKVSNIKTIIKLPNQYDSIEILEVIDVNDKVYYIEIDANKTIQTIKEDSIDGNIIYKGGLDSLFDF